MSLFTMLRRAVCASVEAAPRLASVGDVAMTRNIRWIPNGAVARVTTSASALDKLGKPPEDNGAAARRAEVRRVTVIPPRDPLSRGDPYNDLEVHGCPLSHLSPPKPQLNPPSFPASSIAPAGRTHRGKAHPGMEQSSILPRGGERGR